MSCILSSKVSMDTLILSSKKYQIVYADPPWRFTGLGSKGIRSAKLKESGLHVNRPVEEKYPTMSIAEIKMLPIKNIIDKDAVLFLWTTDAHLPFALEVMESWGFQYVTIAFIWLKKTVTNKNVCYYGYWTMKGQEICLLGRHGKPKPIAHNIRQLVEAKRREHSRKPDEVRDRIVKLMGDLPRIELFAREQFLGWDTWGNNTEYFD